MDLATIQDWTKNERERSTAADHLSAINTIATCLNGSESPNAVAVMIIAIYSNIQQLRREACKEQR